MLILCSFLYLVLFSTSRLLSYLGGSAICSCFDSTTMLYPGAVSLCEHLSDICQQLKYCVMCTELK